MLVNSALVVGHGVMMFPLLRRHVERIAVGYLGARLVESVVLAVGIVFRLVNIPLGRDYLKAALT
jgi:hypothetical protein